MRFDYKQASKIGLFTIKMYARWDKTLNISDMLQ